MPSADLRVDPHKLSLDRRGEGVGRRGVVIDVTPEYLHMDSRPRDVSVNLKNRSFYAIVVGFSHPDSFYIVIIQTHKRSVL